MNNLLEIQKTIEDLKTNELYIRHLTNLNPQKLGIKILGYYVFRIKVESPSIKTVYFLVGNDDEIMDYFVIESESNHLISKVFLENTSERKEFEKIMIEHYGYNADTLSKGYSGEYLDGQVGLYWKVYKAALEHKGK